jgi:hypothetical protein
MLEGIQILIDRMEIFPDDFREGGKLHDFLHILDETNYYQQILTKEEVAAYREATLKFRRENLNRAVLEAVMQGHSTQRENKLLKEMRSFTQKSGLYGEVAVGGAGGGGTGVIGGGAFTTKIGALFTPANTTQKKKK